MVIRVLDHVEHASTYDEGDVIFKLLAPRLMQGEDVALSFDGVSAVPSAFINASSCALPCCENLSPIPKEYLPGSFMSFFNWFSAFSEK